MPPTEQMLKWIRENLGVKGSGLPTPTGTNVKPSDDANAKSSDDANANLIGADKISAAPDARGGQSAPTKKTLENDVKDLDKELKEVGDVLNDEKKFEEAKRKWGVKSRYGQYAKDTDDSRFWDDLETGNAKLREYYDYIQKATDIAINSFDLTGLERLKATAQRMKSLAGKLKGSWDKFSKARDKIKEAYTFYESLSAFADATIAMNPRNRKTVMPWVESMKKLKEAMKSFFDLLKKLPGQPGAVAKIVDALIEVGLGGLEAGVKVVTAYLDRYDRIMEEIDRQSGKGAWKPSPPPPPPEPSEWKSREQRAGEAKVQEMTDLVGKIREARDGKARQAKEAKEKALKEAREKYDREHKQAIDDFNNNLFPKIYLQSRKTLRQTIITNLRNRKQQDANDKWLGCLISNDAVAQQTGGETKEPIDDDPNYSRKGGVYISPTKVTVNLSEAREEVARFMSVKPPFPDFNKLHDPGLEKHLAKVAGPFKPPE